MELSNIQLDYVWKSFEKNSLIFPKLQKMDLWHENLEATAQKSGLQNLLTKQKVMGQTLDTFFIYHNNLAYLVVPVIRF